jgi:hypothetical protein
MRGAMRSPPRATVCGAFLGLASSVWLMAGADCSEAAWFLQPRMINRSKTFASVAAWVVSAHPAADCRGKPATGHGTRDRPRLSCQAGRAERARMAAVNYDEVATCVINRICRQPPQKFGDKRHTDMSQGPITSVITGGRMEYDRDFSLLPAATHRPRSSGQSPSAGCSTAGTARCRLPTLSLLTNPHS